MPLYKFRVCWEEDDNIYRDIVLKNGQSFQTFQEAILKAFEFKTALSASFFESNDKWLRAREISSEVLVNKKEAPALSMIKTPVSALVDNPDKKFIYVYDPDKKWTFLISLIGVEKEEDPKTDYPFVSKSEGIAPSQTTIKGIANERLMEVEEKYDLLRDDMEEQGFGEDPDSVGDSEDDMQEL
jgi:hypothetical protein